MNAFLINEIQKVAHRIATQLLAPIHQWKKFAAINYNFLRDTFYKSHLAHAFEGENCWFVINLMQFNVRRAHNKKHKIHKSNL